MLSSFQRIRGPELYVLTDSKANDGVPYLPAFHVCYYCRQIALIGLTKFISAKSTSPHSNKSTLQLPSWKMHQITSPAFMSIHKNCLRIALVNSSRTLWVNLALLFAMLSSQIICLMKKGLWPLLDITMNSFYSVKMA
jgi:hypothetical protein